jgi:dTDP-4-amino-4,6-dideoxygalactose transaminase/intein/homing endonuclease
MDNGMKDKIREFIDSLENVPRFAHNQHSDRVYYSGPDFSKEELVECIDTLLNGKWASAGEKVKEFEAKMASYVNQQHALMVNSGSSANLVAIAAAKKRFGWSDNDEIILSVVGFPTTLNPIIQNNLKPIFVDIELDSLNFDLDEVEKKITPKTKAIFVSPVLGSPPDIDRLVQISKRHNVMLLLDCCDSLGSKWDGKHLSEYFVFSTMSFYPAHHITTLQGGMICSNDEEFIRICRSLATWGRACFTAGAKVLTNNGVKAIENISDVDKVYTHTGQWKNVSDTFINRYHGEFYTVKCSGSEEFTVTKFHPFLVLENSEIKWKDSHDLKIGDILLEKIQDIDILNDKDFAIKYVVKNSKSKNITKSFTLKNTNSLMLLSGLWLAEGSLASGLKGSNGKNSESNGYKFYRVDFTFNKNEAEYIQTVCCLMKEIFGVSLSQRKGSGNGVTLSFKSRKAYEFFSLFGKRSYNKRLPSEFYQFSNDRIKYLLRGFWKGDGSFCRTNHSYSISTTSDSLFYQFKILLSRFGIYPGISVRSPEDHKTNEIDGIKVVAKRNLYTLNMYGENSSIFHDIAGEDLPKRDIRALKANKSIDGYILHKIVSIDTSIKDSEVFNLEVEDDHSYHVNGIISHNCYCSGAENLLSNGICRQRFSKWIDCVDHEIDHKYLFTNIGYNLAPLDMQGAIGLVQMEKLDSIHVDRARNKESLDFTFRSIEGVKTYGKLEKADVSWFGVPLMCESATLKRKLVAHLEKNWIQTRNYFAGNILIHPAYSHLDNYLDYPCANLVLERVFFVGCSQTITQEKLARVDRVVWDFIGGKND